MGDRANILVRENKEDNGVYLYTHWRGTELPQTLQNALKTKWRWDDCAYLTRIIFCKMVSERKEVNNETGYGISSYVGDGRDRVLVVDVESQLILVDGKEKKYTFEEYIDLNKHEISEVWI